MLFRFPEILRSFEKNLKNKMTESKIKLYSLATPNGVKVAAALEEMGLAYEPFTINIMKGDQFKPEFIQVNVKKLIYCHKLNFLCSPIPKFRLSQIPTVQMVNPSTYSSLVQFCFTWLRKLENFYRKIRT